MSNTILYTLPQWFIFAGVFVITYGWVENKKAFRIIGESILLLLGVYSVFILAGDYFAGKEFLTPEEIAIEEIDEEIIDEIPFEAKLLPAYWSFIVSALTMIPAIIFEILNNKKYSWFVVISGLIALIGFFIIVGALKSL